jgi:hypothetical protein
MAPTDRERLTGPQGSGSGKQIVDRFLTVGDRRQEKARGKIFFRPDPIHCSDNRLFIFSLKDDVRKRTTIRM